MLGFGIFHTGIFIDLHKCSHRDASIRGTNIKHKKESRVLFKLCSRELEAGGRVDFFADGKMLPRCRPHLLLDGRAGVHINPIVWQSPAFQEEQPARGGGGQMSWLPGGEGLPLLCSEGLPLPSRPALANDRCL